MTSEVTRSHSQVVFFAEFLSFFPMATAPLVYFVLGTPGSGRRDLVRDLIENGLAPEDRALVLVAEGESTDDSEQKLALRAGTEIRRCGWTATALPDLKLPEGGTVFFVADSRADPITQIESLKPWLVQHGAELARIITVVDCHFAEQHSALRHWYEASIHFSDVVILTKREGVANKWISDFLRHYHDLCSPSLFIQLKKGGLPNPALVLDPLPRRFSQYFEEEEDLSGIEIETDDEEGVLEGEEDDGVPKPEVYFERLRSGHRAKPLPDLKDYLPKK